jgi:hypothetical protein
MRLGKVLASTAVAISLIGAPVAAQAAGAEAARIGSSVEGENLAGGLLIPILAALALGLIIWQVADSDEEPTSP